ncbi:MAG: DNA/RNA nuclease SfsA [Candidatus Thorarchaeota archaeon]|jgi:sugar fermentation stimulation protein A
MEKPRVRKAILVERPNRFLGVVNIDGALTEVFIPNPGRMHELMVPGYEVYLRENSAPHRKTDFDMIGLEYDGVLVSIDSNLPNRFIKHLLNSNKLPFFKNYNRFVTEPRAYDGRFDFRLEGPAGITFIEVKSCTLVEDGRAIFPDSPTIRGVRHLRNLSNSLKEGVATRAAIIFVIQRPDAQVFSPNDKTDPEFGDAIRQAHSDGVEVYPLITEVVDWQLKLIRKIPYELDYYT